jgi:5-(carboxyamino)imidazole ribonucleotide synthase
MTVAPLSTIGIIGGGQLGRMLAIAAAQLGYNCHIYAPDERCPAADVAVRWTHGAYDDADALAQFAGQVDIVTYEFENIPFEPVAALAKICPVSPNPKALQIAQDRALEKSFVDGLGARTAPWAEVDSLEDLEQAITRIGTPAILKTRRNGYDGKGQARIRSAGDAGAAWQAIGGYPALLEGFVHFEHEFSIIVARSADGGTVSWDPPENVHADGILDTSTVPAHADILAQTGGARSLALRVAEELDYVGVLTFEFFAGSDGPVFNEMAPRVHNSGHWTIEGAVTSQFENHIRAICGLPLGSTTLTAPCVEMRNLIGEQANDWATILADPTAHLHLYGKRIPRPGRKMGHVTRVGFGTTVA